MKFAVDPLARRGAPLAGAFAVVCALALGGPVLAQGGDTAARRATARLINIDEPLMTTGENARLAERIVWAKCLSVEVQQLGGANIETHFDFEIIETVKGTFAGGHRPGNRFVVTIPEGQVGAYRSESQPPFPKFEPNDEVVLFVGRDRPQNLPGAVISPTQSTYRVRTDARGRKTVTPTPTGLPLYRAADGTAHERMPDRPQLEDFLFSLRRHVSGQ